MDETTQTSTPATAPAPAPEVAKEAAKGAAYGTILGIILIVGVLVAGAFYVWGERLSTTDQAAPEEMEGVRGDTLPFDGSAEGSVDIDVNGPTPQ